MADFTGGCGAAAGLKGLQDKIASVDQALDDTLESATEGIADVLDSIESIVSSEVGSLKAGLQSMIPATVQEKAEKLEDGVKDAINLAATVAAGGQQAINAAYQLKTLKEKWDGILGSVEGQLDPSGNPIKDFDQLLGVTQRLLSEGSADLNSICKMVPNITEPLNGVDIKVQAVPLSFPEIDAVDLIKGYKLPNIPEPKFVIDVVSKTSEAEKRFVTFKTPKIYKGPRG